MSALHQAAEDYIMVRRALGSRLEGYPRLLAGFVACLEAAGATTVTTELADRKLTFTHEQCSATPGGRPPGAVGELR